jgi:hypothetical protein
MCGCGRFDRTNFGHTLETIHVEDTFPWQSFAFELTLNGRSLSIIGRDDTKILTLVVATHEVNNCLNLLLILCVSVQTYSTYENGLNNKALTFQLKPALISSPFDAFTKDKQDLSCNLC